MKNDPPRANFAFRMNALPFAEEKFHWVRCVHSWVSWKSNKKYSFC
jgi:hypothetical protein